MTTGFACYWLTTETVGSPIARSWCGGHGDWWSLCTQNWHFLILRGKNSAIQSLDRSVGVENDHEPWILFFNMYHQLWAVWLSCWTVQRLYCRNFLLCIKVSEKHEWTCTGRVLHLISETKSRVPSCGTGREN